MKRIMLMVLNNILFAPYWFLQLVLYGRKNDRHTVEERFALLKKITVHANRGGRVTIQAEGLYHLPDEDGFILYPNHQGLFDVLAFVESCSHPFTVVMKKEVQNVPFLKQVFSVMRARAIDREDVRQAMKVILDMAEDVRRGINYVIFAEGTRSKNGNNLQDFKGGSFKAAIKAKCPIVPVAVIDSYKPFDVNSIEPVTVQVHYLKPLYYEDYKDLKSVEIAKTVKTMIQEKINEKIEESAKK
ncbi:lysophospholipid acyltransferase family protein [Ruminococcus gauvreauii]|uniref:1-acyl-sn-glycerol-3-phosphate acyltransferase n=2 Tax=Ruminococcus gauvreauii TaxID=438033 RepID=A0ABY5VPY2_9FIRM|nr:lysophospholipid acyltransferase family protein [Ruminococcus gauvreauii]UWP61173.1 1-acyl-sn-glycerol-3-phosphate acyltransferase [Ruminococcus gauvreauii]